ncbi:MAG: hypothetical protein RB191_11490 [Terriglobia bacterium]|nr:hypothetical protein [Terriglobia bacterium]
MNLINRQARAKARVKTMNLRRTGVPCTASKWGYMPDWKGPGSPRALTPGEVMSNRRLARFNDPGMQIAA